MSETISTSDAALLRLETLMLHISNSIYREHPDEARTLGVMMNTIADMLASHGIDRMAARLGHHVADDFWLHIMSLNEVDTARAVLEKFRVDFEAYKATWTVTVSMTPEASVLNNTLPKSVGKERE